MLILNFFTESSTNLLNWCKYFYLQTRGGDNKKKGCFPVRRHGDFLRIYLEDINSDKSKIW